MVDSITLVHLFDPGFCVAKTKDVISTAKALKEGGEGSSIQELSIVDVPLGKVSILALSADSSTLAASVGSNIYFFSVAGLLNKVCAAFDIFFANCITFKLGVNKHCSVLKLWFQNGLL